MAVTSDPPPKSQRAIIQRQLPSGHTSLPLSVEDDVAVPALSSPHDILVRVLAVALNHCDYKMPTNFPSPGNMAGCDFCGVVVARAGSSPEAAPSCETGARVCGGVFPYGGTQGQVYSGAFAQFLAVDSRLVLRVPDTWSDLEAAGLGAVGWGTVGLALSDPQALGLGGFPSAPAEEPEPVLVYGGATATGTMACQLLSLSGHRPIAVASPESAELARKFGAKATASYTSPTCADDVRALCAADGEPIRRALDCITSADSAATCFVALARTGGRYACVEKFPDSWRTRRAVKVKEVMGYEGLGRNTQLSGAEAPGVVNEDNGVASTMTTTTTYTRKADTKLAALCARWAIEMQRLLDAGLIMHHPIREVAGCWEGVIEGLLALQRGEVRREKLVVRISDMS